MTNDVYDESPVCVDKIGDVYLMAKGLAGLALSDTRRFGLALQSENHGLESGTSF